MIIILNNLLALLSQLISPQASPHTALLVSRSNGSVLASRTVASAPPFPLVPFHERSDDERVRLYAAVASSTWDEERGKGSVGDGTEPVLRIEADLGRLSVVALGGFLLVLVGVDVAPWSVLDKKIKLADEQLREPLQQVGQLA